MDLDGMQRLLWHFASHRVVTTASRAGILRRLAGTQATALEVAADLNLEAAPCAKVLHALTALGILEAQNDVFTVTGDLQASFEPGDQDLSPFLEHSHHMYENWGSHLENWLKGGEWPHSQRSPEHTLNFAKAMAAIGRRTAQRAEPLLDLDRVNHMLDVGGGHGHWCEVFCSKHPALRATVFDIPGNSVSGREKIAEGAFAERIDFIGGDYLEDDLGGPYDLVLIANVLHQEDSTRAPRLLKKCANAAGPGGHVAVVDFQIDEARTENVFGTLFAINMRNFGDTWTEGQIRQWMENSGLHKIERRDFGTDRWIIIGEKAL